MFDRIVGDDSALHSHTHYFFALSQRTRARPVFYGFVVWIIRLRGIHPLSLLIVNSGITLDFFLPLRLRWSFKGFVFDSAHGTSRKGYDRMSNLTDVIIIVRAWTEPVLHLILPSAATRSLCWKRNSPRRRDRQVERTCSNHYDLNKIQSWPGFHSNTFAIGKKWSVEILALHVLALSNLWRVRMLMTSKPMY